MKSKKKTHTTKDLQEELATVGEIISPESNIIEAIEKLVLEEDITMLDAILHISESRGIEIEYMAAIVKKAGNFKKRLAEEAKELHCLK